MELKVGREYLDALRNLKKMKCPHNLKHAKFVEHEILEEASKL